MVDGARHELVEAASLDRRARALVEGLPDEAVDQLATAWRGAVRQQDDEVDAAIEGSLSLLPRVVRRRVLRVLTRGRT